MKKRVYRNFDISVYDMKQLQALYDADGVVEVHINRPRALRLIEAGYIQRVGGGYQIGVIGRAIVERHRETLTRRAANLCPACATRARHNQHAYCYECYTLKNREYMRQYRKARHFKTKVGKFQQMLANLRSARV